MLNWIKNHKISFLVAFLGAAAGYAYWYFIGCESGSCAITSVWYRTAAYGAFMGWLVGDFANDKFNKKENKTDHE
ncbi:MAG: hypothetical protein CMD31_13370 [Flavobacteriales bacterium]|nr:hypothetical protein [Flavobacteriales bacterium]MBQ21738.1 hypothetical protein [Flavobacteriales bacterium]|tara:strand:- start:32098 stop:32322 length:225 start_codon:yes stop_codon:yes gene_type:complete